MHAPHDLLELAVLAAREAGALLRAEALRPGGPRGTSRVAPADAEAEAAIRDRLEAATPSFGVRGEELTDRDRPPAAPDGPVWLIDPNDGTSAFHAGWRGSAVSIGLVAGGVPVLGVVYAYLAPTRHLDADGGDLIAWAEGAGPVRRNGVPMPPRVWPERLGPGTTLLVAHRADRRAYATARAVAPARYRPMPSIAYRLALVAVGDGDATVSIAGPADYDIAGGHAILRGAGGALVGRDGREIAYDAAVRGRVVACFGGAPALLPGLVATSPPLRVDEDPADDGALVEPIRGGLVHDAGALERAIGCLLGQLAGDALGSLVEFESAASIARRYPGGVRALEDGGTFHTIAGQPTDDSELALLLARSLVEIGGFDAESVARAYGGWHASHPFDEGNTTRQALSAAASAAEQGRSAAEAARVAASTTSQANGALMRVSPLGIFGWRLDPDVLADHARADAALTHPDPVCRDVSALFAVLVAKAVREGPTPEALFAYAVDYAASRRLHPDVRATIAAAAEGPPADFVRNMGWVRLALHNALVRLRAPGTVEDAIAATIAGGGDTDTNACIAGALLGAVHGRRALPAGWEAGVLTCRPVARLPGVRRPRPKRMWPVDALVLAERLLGAGERAARSGAG
jgi:ADP-ribosyl-[dinitrogen reductase] hydrolase